MASTLAHNKEHFDKLAASYDSRHEKTLGQLIKEIQARLDFIGVDWADDDDDDEENQSEKANNGGDKAKTRAVRLLDYACGTGVVSRALAPYTTQCVGIDLSDGMVAAYNSTAENQGLAASEMRAYVGNLCAADDPKPAAFESPEFYEFDIAAVGLGFHHFEDPALAARRLVERLRPGGVLLILDFLPHGEPDPGHAAAKTITHHGFSEEQIRNMYEAAGAGKDFALDDVAVVFNKSSTNEEANLVGRRIFLARGTKA